MTLTREQLDEWREDASEGYAIAYPEDSDWRILALIEALDAANETAVKFCDDYHAEVHRRIDAEAKVARARALLEPAVIYDAIHPADPPLVIHPVHIKARHLRAALDTPTTEGGEVCPECRNADPDACTRCITEATEGGEPVHRRVSQIDGIDTCTGCDWESWDTYPTFAEQHTRDTPTDKES